MAKGETQRDVARKNIGAMFAMPTGTRDAVSQLLVARKNVDNTAHAITDQLMPEAFSQHVTE
eukprot:1813165-Pyramimonas_sp.AAC.1